MTNPTISIRLERNLKGSPSNYGHDMALFGLFSNGSFSTATGNKAASALMAHGMTCPQAEALLDMVATQNVAFDVTNGTTVLL